MFFLSVGGATLWLWLSRKRSQRIYLGLALLSCLAKGEPLTFQDIAAWCDCSPSHIHAIYKRAMGKVRRRLKDL